MSARRWGLASGTRLGRYEVISGIARGGMGEVYLARMHTDAGAFKQVAIKRILPHHLDDEEVRRMFFREGRIALLLDHPNVVQIFDLAELDGEHIICMEYIRGESVRSLIRSAEQAPLPLDLCLGLLIQLAHALSYVHRACGPDGEPLHLLHRDVSPENVMVRFDGGLKLIDFGIARIAQQTFATRVDVMKGKMGYMSPEQLRQDPLDERSDIYQLGILAYELTTGRRLFDGPNFASVMNQVLAGEHALPSQVLSDYPAQLEQVVERALAFEPEDRPDSALEFADALLEVASELGLSTTQQRVAAELTRRFPPAATTSRLSISASDAPTAVEPGTPATQTARRPGPRWPIAALVVALVAFALAAFLDGRLETAATERATLVAWRLQLGLLFLASSCAAAGVLGFTKAAIGARKPGPNAMQATGSSL